MKRKSLAKILALLTALCLCLSLVPAAFAANGPFEATYEDDGEYMAYVTFCELDEEGYWLEDGAVEVFCDNTVKNEMKGATYDRGANTLTIKDLTASNYALETNMMGDDFKLNVVGNCALASIGVYGGEHGGGLSIVGNGTLTVNKSKKSDIALGVFPEGADSKVTFGKSVTVRLYGAETEDAEDEVISAVAYGPETDPFVFADGKKSPAVQKKNILTPQKQVEGLTIEQNEDSTWQLGYKVTKNDDPEGIYAAKLWTDIEKNADRYGIKKYIYSEAYGCLIEDRAFLEGVKNPYIGLEMTEEEMTDAGYAFVIEPQPANVYYLSYDEIPTDDLFWYYGSDRVARASDPDGLYGIISRTMDGNEVVTEYTIGRFVWDDELSDRYDLPFMDPEFEVVVSAQDFETSDEWSIYYEDLPVELEEKGIHAEFGFYDIYADNGGTEYGVQSWYTDDGEELRVFTVAPAQGLDGVLIFELTTEVDAADLTPVPAGDPEEEIYWVIPGRRFDYKGAAAATVDPVKTFKDISSKKAWYYAAVSYAVNNGLFAGSNGKFDPDGDMTRGMFVSVLARMAGVDINNNVKTKFSDVKKGAWYTGAVKWASENGIVSGSGGKFMPNDPITREQICAILVTYSKYMKITLTPTTKAVTFKDAKKISKWAKSAVAACQRAGLIAGSNGSFDPQGKATRAAVAQILMQFDKNFG